MCESRATVEGSEDVESAWTAAFMDNTKWQGLYDYNGQSVQFTLVVQSASDNVVKATLGDHVTQLELIGSPITYLL